MYKRDKTKRTKAIKSPKAPNKQKQGKMITHTQKKTETGQHKQAYYTVKCAKRLNSQATRKIH